MSNNKLNIVDLEFAAEIKKARIKAGLSQERFGKLFEISKGYVLMLENGQRSPSVLLKKEIKQWLESELSSKTIETSFGGSTMEVCYQIPILDRVSSGITQELSEYTGEYLAVPGAPKDCFALRVHGEAMAPIIRHGDYVLFVIDRVARQGDVVVVNDDFGDSIIRKLKEKKGDLFLVSENPDYPAVKPNEEYRIMGVVVDVWRRIPFKPGQ
ncbi:S24 family peptidase [Desulfobulbus sp.]|uniref:helix-turn-helix domain-containing protein n=1 Tax=Desulfobulbus sp. TaxID=895 RepID=UPI00286EB5BF|nr:S24 family peptidase [Desulfobulbus sp.]